MNELIELLTYDETSPSGLRWNTDRYCGNNHNRLRVAVGDVAGHLESNGYWRVALGKIRFAAHRLIFFMHHGYLPSVVDHADGNQSNNVIFNLRDSTNRLNQHNRKVSKGSKSGANGVSFYEKTVKGVTYQYWRATWRDSQGIPHEKYFRVTDNGNALTKAKEHRKSMMDQLNKEGAGYTNRGWRDEDDL